MDETTPLRRQRRVDRKKGGLSFWYCCMAGVSILAAFGLAAFIWVAITSSNLTKEEMARVEKDMLLMAKDAELDAKDMELMNSTIQLEAKDMELMNSITQLEAKDMVLMNNVTSLQDQINQIPPPIPPIPPGNDTAVYDRRGLPQKNINMAQNPIDWVPVYQPPFVTQTSPTDFTFNEAGIYTFQLMLPTALGGSAADAREAMVINWLVCIVPSIGPVSNALNSYTYYGNLFVDNVAVSNENRVIAQGEVVHFELNLQVPNTFNTATGANPGTNTINTALVSPNSCCDTNLIIKKVA